MWRHDANRSAATDQELAPGLALEAFEAGVDDYVTRPFHEQELVARVGALLGATLLGFFGLLQLAEFTAGVSLTIQPMLGLAGFLATFLFQVSDILRIGTPLMGALVSGSVVGNLLGRIGQRAAETRPAGSVRVINLVTAAAAGATIFALTGALIEWLYQIGRPEFTLWIPMAVGSGLGLILAPLLLAMYVRRWWPQADWLYLAVPAAACLLLAAQARMPWQVLRVNDGSGP